MTLNAMDWVWRHSQSTGNTRLALLYVADQVRTHAAETQLGQRELMRALNTTSKATAEKAIADALKLGELELLVPSKGRRAALYRLPKAAGYVRNSADSALDSGAQDSATAPVSGAQQDEGTSLCAPVSGAQEKVCAPDPDACAPVSGAPSPFPKKQASPEAGRPDAFQICQPLITAMTQAGITVSWSMKPADWIEIASIVTRAGAPAMVAFARKTEATSRQPIRYATFFLRGGWRGLPPTTGPAPQQATTRPEEIPHCGDPDCDPRSRTRDAETANGLRYSVRCPDCHPAKESAA